MRKLLFIATLFIILTSCYKDDINDLKTKYDQLEQEQIRQANLLEVYKTLIDALEKKHTINAIEEIENGYKIIFSDGKKIDITNGKDGHSPVISIGEDGSWIIDNTNTNIKAVGQTPTIEIINGIWYINGESTGIRAISQTPSLGSPAITYILDMGDIVIFGLNNGSSITVAKLKPTITALYILSEGSMGNNNSDLAYYTFADNVIQKKFYSQKNSSSLGDTGNDLKIYGSNLYCAVSGPNMSEGGYIRVIDPKTGINKQIIPISNSKGENDMPRRILPHNGKLFITLYSGELAIIDTLSMSLIKNIKLSGTYSEGLTLYKNKIIIANSGQGEGNTLSVVSLSDYSEVDVITVPKNPLMVVSSPYGGVFLTTGDLSWSSGEKSNLHLIDIERKEIVKTYDIKANKMAIYGNNLYTCDTDWTDYSSVVKKINLSTNIATDFITDKTSFYMAYNINVNPLNGDVYITEMGQTVYCFGQDGKLKFKLKTGAANTTEVVFIF